MKEIGKIESIDFGMGGYQDAMIGFRVTLSGKGWGCGDWRGPWARWHEGCKWTVEDQTKQAGEAVLWMRDILKAAKKSSMAQLVGVPVEVTFENYTLKSWRILDEVL